MQTNQFQKSQRIFSENKHRAGSWQTSRFSPSIPLLRSLVHYFSFKRALVDRCAGAVAKNSMVLDLGCGNGAYACWFQEKRPCIIIGLDWSFSALRKIKAPQRGTFLRVCADANYLPFKQETFDGLYTIDTIGHTGNPQRVLGEIWRVLRDTAPASIHSECRDYMSRWPDRILIRRNSIDVPAQFDGHYNLLTAQQLQRTLEKYFILEYSESPAGYAGWLLGYPEKYYPAFQSAGLGRYTTLVKFFAACKRHRFAGFIMRFLNVSSNHLEIRAHQFGGGSYFAFVKKRTPVQMPTQIT